MKKKLYIVLISILAIVISSTAFIPSSNKFKTVNEKSNAEITHTHPDAGYIEEIGK